MSRLYGLARQASEYIRNRFMRQYREADEVVQQRSGGLSAYAQKRRGLFTRVREAFDDSVDPLSPPGGFSDQRAGAPPIDPEEVKRRSQSGAPPIAMPPAGTTPPDPDIWGGGTGGTGYSPPKPPVQPPIQPPAPKPPKDDPPTRPPLGRGGEEQHDEIQLLGRDAGYDEDDFAAVMSGTRRTPGSTNVYGYYFERESRRTGILYVTFLQSYRGESTGSGPGPTYAYYDVTVKKALEFQKSTAESAGGAVWDYLRVRGSIWAHQHQYRLVHVSGEYVPRKVTKLGYKSRAVPSLGVGRREYRRNTLPARTFHSRGGPDRGGPDRAEPDRGSPF